MAKDKKIVTAFGRMNPPTTGHQKLINAVLNRAKVEGADHDIRLSHTHDAKKNPLTQDQKLSHARKLFPKVNFSGSSKEHPSFIHHLKELHSKGYTHVSMIAGSDRADEYQKLVDRYNKPKEEGGEFHFKSIKIHSAGHRDPDAEGTEGMSASKMREHAKQGDYDSFKAGLPRHTTHDHAQEMYNQVRHGMSIKEAYIARFKSKLTEIANTTLKSYINKASQDRTKSLGDEKRYNKRLAGVSTAVKKVASEGLEEARRSFTCKSCGPGAIADYSYSYDDKSDSWGPIRKCANCGMAHPIAPRKLTAKQQAVHDTLDRYLKTGSFSRTESFNEATARKAHYKSLVGQVLDKKSLSTKK